MCAFGLSFMIISFWILLHIKHVDKFLKIIPLELIKKPSEPILFWKFPEVWKCLTLIFILDYFIMNETSGWEEAAAFCNFQQRNTKIQLWMF